MNIEQKIAFIFNRILIDFFKEIKKDNYHKVAIKKNYKVIDKRTPQYIKLFIKKTTQHKFDRFFMNANIDFNNLDEYKELFDINIFKNIKIGKLLRTFEKDKENILSYLFTLYLLSYLYRSFREEITEYNEKEDKLVEEEAEVEEETEAVEEEVEDEEAVEAVEEEAVEEDEEADEEDEADEEVEEDEEADEEDEEVDEEADEEVEEVEEVDELTQILSGQQEMLLSVINILEKINKKIDVTNELSEIMDDDIKQVLMNINKVKYTIKMEGGIDDIIGDSKIGNLAKEISDSINLDDLNIDNPNDLLDPSKLFNSENGNVLGNLVQQVGTSITDKLSSGEIKQDELISDAFNLMNKMQNGTANNPILSDMFSNMMNNSSSTDADASPDASTNDSSPTDFTNMMQNMMNPEIIQNMMSSMGGMQGINQNNPNSREGQMRQKLQNKLKEKK